MVSFRPCIDIHNGKVKQIVGSSLKDEGDKAKENFVSTYDADYYARLYQEYQLPGGHVILLNSKDSPYYEATKHQAEIALKSFPNGLMVGGGITDENAAEFLDMGASHVIVTSYVFKDGQVNMENLEKLKKAVGKEKIVLDLSCKKRDEEYYVVTDRWQKFTNVHFNEDLFNDLAGFCDEYLVHAADVEGKSAGLDIKVLKMLSNVNHTVTYAGGISSYEDIRLLIKEGKGNVNFTIGSKLDLFGGSLTIEEILECIQ